MQTKTKGLQDEDYLRTYTCGLRVQMVPPLKEAHVRRALHSSCLNGLRVIYLFKYGIPGTISQRIACTDATTLNEPHIWLEARALFPCAGYWDVIENETYDVALLPRGSFQALALDPGYWPALESLENVKSLAVDRWHFRMLNHSARNEAYSRAIQRAVADAAASDKNQHGSEVRLTRWAI